MKAQKVVGSVTKEKKYSMREMSDGERWREEGGAKERGRKESELPTKGAVGLGIIKRSALCCAL